MLFLLANWKAIVAAIGVAVVALFLHNWDVDRLEKRHIKELSEQAEFLQAECKKDQELAQGVSREYQAKISTLSDQLIRYKRMHNAKRDSLPASSSASGHNGTTETREHVRSDGNDVGDFLDFGAEAEKYRVQLEGCQAFILRTFEAKSH